MRTCFANFQAVLAGLLAVGICGCGDSGNEFPPSYVGVWDGRYVFSVDDCQIALPGVQGFLDQHTFEQSGNTLTISAKSGFFNQTPATIDSNGSFETEAVSEGDIFGVGTYCQLTSRVSYETPHENESATLFSQTIVCNDGYSCETTARGTALKQPAS